MCEVLIQIFLSVTIEHASSHWYWYSGAGIGLEATIIIMAHHMDKDRYTWGTGWVTR